MRVLICGDRNWSDEQAIYDIIVKESPGVIIEGEARGADKIAGHIGKKLNIKVEKYPANWSQYHRVAGIIRNTQMLIEGKPDLVIAFHDDLANSKGTKNMVYQALKANIKVNFYSHQSGYTT